MNETQSKFLQAVVPAALASQKLTGIPASITIAQAILESGWGQSALARQANNYFGIKATAHLSPNEYIEFPTYEFVDGRKKTMMAKFARYASPSASFAAHARLIAEAPRYRAAMAEIAHGIQDFADALKECGYSTSPDYGLSLMELIYQFDLQQYDLPPDPELPAAAAAKEKAA